MTGTKTETKRGRPTAASVDNMLKGLRAANETLLAAEKRVNDAVSILRSPDVNGYCLASWQEVGDALGVSRQAAQQRYNRRGL